MANTRRTNRQPPPQGETKNPQQDQSDVRPTPSGGGLTPQQMEELLAQQAALIKQLEQEKVDALKEKSNHSKGPLNHVEQEGETEHTVVTGCLHPFTDHIMKEIMPKNFRLLGGIEAYDGTAEIYIYIYIIPVN